MGLAPLSLPSACKVYVSKATEEARLGVDDDQHTMAVKLWWYLFDDAYFVETLNLKVDLVCGWKRKPLASWLTEIGQELQVESPLRRLDHHKQTHSKLDKSFKV